MAAGLVDNEEYHIIPHVVSMGKYNVGTHRIYAQCITYVHGEK